MVQLSQVVGSAAVLAKVEQAPANIVRVICGMRGMNLNLLVFERHQYGINAIHTGAGHQSYPGFHVLLVRGQGQLLVVLAEQLKLGHLLFGVFLETSHF